MPNTDHDKMPLNVALERLDRLCEAIYVAQERLHDAMRDRSAADVPSGVWQALVDTDEILSSVTGDAPFGGER